MIYTLRKSNFVAHNIANWARSTSSLGSFNPLCIPLDIFTDKGGTAYASLSSSSGNEH